MADIAYPGGLPIEAEGWQIDVFDGTDWLEIPDTSDISLTGATSTPTTIRTQKRVVKNASKPTPLTVNAVIPIWRPDLRPCRLVTDRLNSSAKIQMRVSTGAEEVLRAKAAALTFAVAATTGAITVAGTGAAAFDWSDYEPGTYIKFGGTAEDYYLLDRVDSAGVGYARQPHVDGATKQHAAAQADLVDAQLRSESFFAHATESQGSTVTSPGGTDGGVANGSVTFEAVDNDVVNWAPIPPA